ncbi:MAG: recombinase family protein [Bacteroides sp.]|nr:recombinase family protein [Bacteroides sp.]
MKRRYKIDNPKQLLDNVVNVIIYCRVSTDEQRQGTSVDVQEARLKAYCTYKGYNLIYEPEFQDCKEDESAKDFDNRPVMQSILKYIKNNRGKVQKLLFLRWNRFSRDLFTATKAIAELQSYGVEPNAIEEELNYDSTSWPVLLGTYLGIAQSDNIARSKATMDGIRGTLKKGKWSNKAPRGYKNVRESKHNCYVVINEEAAKPIREAFIELSKGTISANYARKRYCPNIPESSFFDMLRNPFYMGKIRIPAYKDEPEEIIEGQHEGLISEEVFYKVQDVLDDRNRTKPKLEKAINPDLFLRRFITCPVCGHALTGSTSRGNGGRYTYYNCCEDPKHIRVRAEKAVEAFARYVGCLKPNKAILRLYEAVLFDVQGGAKREIKNEITTLQKQLKEKQKQMENVEDLLISDAPHADRYIRILERYEKEAQELDSRIALLETGNRGNIEPKLDYAISLINNLDKYILDAPVEVKIKLLGSMFDEKIEFDGETYRTNSLNKVLDLIYEQTSELRGGDKRKGDSLSENLQFSTRTRDRTGMDCSNGV